MRDQQGSRSTKLLELGRIGVKSLVREPVKEAVREALAEERGLTENRKRGQSEGWEERASLSDQTSQSESGNRILRPAVVLGLLGLVAVGILLKRQALKRFVSGEEVPDESDDLSETVSNQRSTTPADSIGTDESTSGMGEDGDTDSGSEQPKEFDVDTEGEGLSTTE